MSRISTFGQNAFAVHNLMQVQSKLSEVQTQVATELVSSDYKDIAAETSVLQTMEADLKKSQNTLSNAEMVSGRIDTQYSAIGHMIDLLADYQVTLSAAVSGESAEAASLNQHAQSSLESFETLANTQLGGRYLFGGSNTTRAPVDISDPPYSAQTSPSSANYDYYQGDDQNAVFYTSDNDRLEYGVNAGEDAFEMAIRALSLGANATENPMDETAILEAYDLVNEAMDALLVQQGRLSTSANTLEREIDMEIDYQLRLDAMIGDIKNVDLAAAIAEQEQMQILLEASYNVTISMSKMNLFQYLS